MKRFPVVVALAFAGLLLLGAPALAEYCGPPADTKTIERLTVDRTHHDRTRIMYLAAIDSFALSMVELSGQEALYFAKSDGTWTYAGAFPPSNLPAATKKRFDAIVDAYGQPCLNPNFVNHPSGP